MDAVADVTSVVLSIFLGVSSLATFIWALAIGEWRLAVWCLIVPVVFFYLYGLLLLPFWGLLALGQKAVERHLVAAMTFASMAYVYDALVLTVWSSVAAVVATSHREHPLVATILCFQAVVTPLQIAARDAGRGAGINFGLVIAMLVYVVLVAQHHWPSIAILLPIGILVLVGGQIRSTYVSVKRVRRVA